MKASNQELQEAWAKVIAYAWDSSNSGFLQELRVAPKKKLEEMVYSQEPASIKDYCATILKNASDTELARQEFWAIPDLPAGVENLDEARLQSLATEKTRMMRGTG